VWVINNLNPDGAIAGTRQNARGVDLNRNFSWRWRRLGHPGDWQYAGPRPLSEPETRIARALILRVRPDITIWFHQPLGLVDESGGNPSIERRFARLAGLLLKRLPRYPGSAAGWQNHRLAPSTAFVVELPPGRPSPKRTARLARAVQQLADKPSSSAPGARRSE
jgi:protein MpaA